MHLLEKVWATVAAVAQPHLLLPAHLESFALVRPKTIKLVASRATFPPPSQVSPSPGPCMERGRWSVFWAKKLVQQAQAGVTSCQPHPAFSEMLLGVT